MPTKQQRQDLRNVRKLAPYSAPWFAYYYATQPLEADRIFARMKPFLKRNDLDRCQKCFEPNAHDYQFSGFGVRLRLCGHCRDAINALDLHKNTKLIICTVDI